VCVSEKPIDSSKDGKRGGIIINSGLMMDLSFLDVPYRAGRRMDGEERGVEELPFAIKLSGHPASGLLIPKGDKPGQFLDNVWSENTDVPPLKFLHGTTTLSFIFQGGIIAAVDSRASMGGYIASGTVRKIIEINEYLLGTMAGGAADCSFWERELARQCRVYELRNEERITVAGASKILANTLASRKGYGLSIGTMIMGWDKFGPSIFYVDSDGTRLKGDRFSVGSGSTFAYGVLDQGYRYDMNVDDAVELAKRSIYHATHRDAMSGGYINGT